MKKVLITAPLETELVPVRKALARRKDAFRYSFLTLGVGPKKSAKALEKFLGTDPQWDLVLIVGLAGALTGGLRTGDIVTPSLIEEGASRMEIPPDSSTEGVKQVPFLTVNRILKPLEKEKALEEHPDAQAVDMESFGLAGICLRERLSFKIFRSILDEKDYIFPDFRWVFSQGKAGDVAPFLFYCLRNPRKAARVLDFRRKMKMSLVRLARFTALYLQNGIHNT